MQLSASTWLVVHSRRYSWHPTAVWDNVRPSAIGQVSSDYHATSAVNRKSNATLQWYVDDPALTVGGTREQRTRIILRTFFLWLIIGLELAWKKGQRGNPGDWVGAHFRPWSKDGHRASTRNTQTGGLGILDGRITVTTHAVTRMLWAAAYSGSELAVARRQVLLPLQWLPALADEDFLPLERRC